MDISNLWGLYPTVDSQFGVIDVIQPEMAEITAQNGGVQLFYSFADDNFFFSRRPIHGVEDFEGLETRSHSTVLSDLLAGLGRNRSSSPSLMCTPRWNGASLTPRCPADSADTVCGGLKSPTISPTRPSPSAPIRTLVCMGSGVPQADAIAAKNRSRATPSVTTRCGSPLTTTRTRWAG